MKNPTTKVIFIGGNEFLIFLIFFCFQKKKNIVWQPVVTRNIGDWF